MILVDGITNYGKELTRGLPSSRWCHMVSDCSEEELHAFAARIGCKRAWAQLRPKASAAHYDLTPSRRALAVKLGAIEVSGRELVMRNFDGMRRRQDVAALIGCHGDGSTGAEVALATLTECTGDGGTCVHVGSSLAASTECEGALHEHRY